MPEQQSLIGIGPAPDPTDRLFFALFPGPAAAALIAELAVRVRAQQGLKGKPIATERLHVTLHHLGDYAGLPPHIVDKATAAAAVVAMPPVEVALDRVVSFAGRPRNRPFVLRGGEGVESIMDLQKILGAALEKSGLRIREKAHNVPHVTLLYDDRGVQERFVEAIRWTAHEFVLVHSLLGQTRHVPLGRWPLVPG